MNAIRHTAGFSCAPGSGFFARCPEDGRLLIYGQTCVCGTNSSHPRNRPTVEVKPLSALFDAWQRRENAPRECCVKCSREYARGTVHVCFG
jgi:hypothetical protein